jgi:hypothetical protein
MKRYPSHMKPQLRHMRREMRHLKQRTAQPPPEKTKKSIPIFAFWL